MRIPHTLLLSLLLAAPLAAAQAPGKPGAPLKNGPPAPTASANVNPAPAQLSPELREAIELERRALTAARAGRFEEAAVALTGLAQRFPNLLPAATPGMIRHVSRQAPAGGEARIALLQALVDADYLDPDEGDIGPYAYELALEHLQAGDVEAATAAVARIVTPKELVKLLVDRRFDGIVARLGGADGERFQLQRAARRHVDRLRARAFIDSALLARQVAFGQALTTVGDFEDALALAEQAEAELARDARAFNDPDQRFPMRLVAWQSLYQLDRVDALEAELARQMAADEPLGGAFPRLLLATLYCEQGDIAAAKRSLAPVAPAENLVGMLRADVQVCIAVQEGDAAARDAAVDWIRDHRGLRPPLLTTALLRAGRRDQAAAELIQRLRDPRERGEALLDLQDFRTGTALPGEQRLAAELEAVRARADVQAAVADVGRIREWPIFEP